MSAQTVIDIAKKEIGYKEGPNNLNKYGAIYGMNNVSWCAEFIWWCFHQAKLDNLWVKSAYCPAIETWAKTHNLVVDINKVQAGDLLLFDWTHTGTAEHIEIATGSIDPHTTLVPTIGGNTGPDHIGVNQSNGDGVYAKVRARSVIRTAIRPKY